MQHITQDRARLDATQRRRQLSVLLALAAGILIVTVLLAGAHTIFLPGWWRIDLP